MYPICLSHPMWVRGLKLLRIFITLKPYRVAPYVGAWIETCAYKNCEKREWSHPMWVRGLKQAITF